jgi:hypothetical protein
MKISVDIVIRFANDKWFIAHIPTKPLFPNFNPYPASTQHRMLQFLLRFFTNAADLTDHVSNSFPIIEAGTLM